MAAEERFVRQAFEGLERPDVLLLGVAADVVIVDEVRRCHDEERSRRGACHVESLLSPSHVPVRLQHHAAVGLQPCLDALLSHAFHGGREHADLLLPVGDDLAHHLSRELAGEVDAEGQRTFLAGLQLADDGVVGKRGEDRPLVPYIIIYIGGGGDGVLQVQLAFVLAHVLVAERKLHAAERQETHAVRAFHEMAVEEFCGLHLLAFEDEASHLGPLLERLRAVVLVGLSAPKRLLVELNLFRFGAAIDHRAKVTVADGQRLEPSRRRLRIPKAQRLGEKGNGENKKIRK